MSFPRGPLLQALAERILSNLDLIETLAPDPHDKGFEDPPYSDTQLLISLLGVLVFPHERTPGALGDLVRGYPDVNDVVQVRYSRLGKGRIEIADDAGKEIVIDARDLRDLPRLLRNSIAHFNMRPIDLGGRFGGVRIWNTNDAGEITFVADVGFDKLRPFAEHMLRALADPHSELPLADPLDPLEMLEYHVEAAKQAKAPRIVSHVWDRFLDATGGDRALAQQLVTRILERESRTLDSRDVQ